MTNQVNIQNEPERTRNAMPKPAAKPATRAQKPSAKEVLAEKLDSLMTEKLRELERELLEKIRMATKPVKISELFKGFTPVWASTAGERLQERGHAIRDQHGCYAITPLGVEWLKGDQGK